MAFFSATPERWLQSPNMYAPQQQMALNQMLQMGMKGMQNPSAGFEPIANQARQQFQQQTIPSIAERFTGGFGIPGASSAQRSSGFAQTLGSAGAGLESQLAGQQAQFGQESMGNLLRMLMMGLEPQTQMAYQPEQASGLMQLLGGAAPGLGQAAGYGAMAGAAKGLPWIAKLLGIA
jgi:hypothetical protein